MKYVSTLLAVANMESSKAFYQQVLGLEITADFGDNVTFDDRIALQTLDTWKGFLQGREVTLQHNAAELYFEEDDLDAFCQRLEAYEIAYVHKRLTHPWGQSVLRFYDPDRHIIEVGEPIGAVVRRFLATGLSEEETAERMGVPLTFVMSCH